MGGRRWRRTSQWLGPLIGLAWLGAPAALAADFAPAVDYYSPSMPYAVALGDLNRDGPPDVAVAQYGNGGVSRLLNRGSGTLGPAAFMATGDRAYGVGVADFNGDSTSDLAVANLGADNVSVLRGRGDGGFAPPANFHTGRAPVAVAGGDLNGDGKADLAVVANGAAAVSVLLGRGDGTFASARQVAVGGDYPQRVTLADLNRDGRLDMAVSVANASAVAVLIGRGDGSFSDPAHYRLPDPYNSSPVGITATDLNHDGLADVVATASSIVSVFLGRGDGTFGPGRDYPAHPNGRNGNAKAVVAADFNGDRRVDLAVANSGTTDARSNVAVLPGRGDGTFGAPSGYEVPGADPEDPWVKEYGGAPNSVAVGDLNGDRRPDLAASHVIDNRDVGGVAVLLNSGSWSPDPSPAGQSRRPRSPGLRITSVRVRGHRLRVVVRRKREARGLVRLYVKRRHARRWRRSKASPRAVSIFRRRLRSGRYRLQARFRGTDGWDSARVRARRLVRVR